MDRNKTVRNKKLQERLIRFVVNIVKLCKRLPDDSINHRLIPQLVASGNSSSANYAEACACGSKADFLNKMRIVYKELNETRSHLRVVFTANPSFKGDITRIGKESTELIKIFSTIINKFKSD